MKGPPTPPSATPGQQGTKRLASACTIEDWVGISIAALALATLCLLESTRNPYFWFDELATAALVSDPSLIHMVGAIRAGAEINPPLYEIALRAWTAIFGIDSFSYRIPTALSLGAAIAITWIAARSAFSTTTVMIGIGIAFLGSAPLLHQSSQARFYGLFTLAAACAFAATVFVPQRTAYCHRSFFTVLAAHLLLVYSHTFGFAFSVALAASLFVTDVIDRRYRAWPYVAIAGAWGLFAPWLYSLFQQVQPYAGYSGWLGRPTGDTLLSLLNAELRFLPFILIGLAAVGSGTIPRGVAGLSSSQGQKSTENAQALSIAALAMVAITFVSFVASRMTTPIFLDRYLLPTAIGWALIIARLATYAPSIAIGFPMALAKAVWWAGYLLIATLPIAQTLITPPALRPDLLLSDSLRNLPVVVEDSLEFWPLYSYAQNGAARFRYLLDWDAATDSRARPGAAYLHRSIEVFSNNGYIPNGVETASAFMCNTSEFLVVHSPEFRLFTRRIASDPGLQVKSVGFYKQANILLVQGKSSSCQR
jgi:hypothetical protein